MVGGEDVLGGLSESVFRDWREAEGRGGGGDAAGGEVVEKAVDFGHLRSNLNCLTNTIFN